jgi:hypothetical protein
VAELDDLHRRGVITDEELKDARAKVIAEGRAGRSLIS